MTKGGDAVRELEAGLPYRRELEQLARRIMKGDADVDDVLQEAHVAAWDYARSDSQPIRNMKAFLSKLVRNTAIGMLRRRQADVAAVEELVDAGGFPPPDMAVDRAQRVDKALEGLTNRQREVFVRVVVEGQGQDEIAEAMGISRSTVARNLDKAWRKVRSDTEEEK